MYQRFLSAFLVLSLVFVTSASAQWTWYESDEAGNDVVVAFKTGDATVSLSPTNEVYQGITMRRFTVTGANAAGAQIIFGFAAELGDGLRLESDNAYTSLVTDLETQTLGPGVSRTFLIGVTTNPSVTNQPTFPASKVGGGGGGGTYQQGYDAGFAAGDTSGYNRGYGEGYFDGDEDGYNRGYDAGETAGDAAGYARGYSEGDEDGYVRGYNAGVIVGGNGKVSQAEYDRMVALYQAERTRANNAEKLAAEETKRANREKSRADKAEKKVVDLEKSNKEKDVTIKKQVTTINNLTKDVEKGGKWEARYNNLRFYYDQLYRNYTLVTTDLYGLLTSGVFYNYSSYQQWLTP